MIKIDFERLEAGWIEGKIITEENNLYFSYSWISNFLNDLLKAFLYVGGYIENRSLDRFTAYSEPAIDDWLFNKKDNDLVIQINCFKDETRNKQIEITEIRCDYNEFMDALFESLTRLIKRVGIYGYRTEWEEEFPISLYMKLYDVLNHSHYLDLNKLSLEKTYNQGGQVSNISNELTLISEILK